MCPCLITSLFIPPPTLPLFIYKLGGKLITLGSHAPLEGMTLYLPNKKISHSKKNLLFFQKLQTDFINKIQFCYYMICALLNNLFASLFSLKGKQNSRSKNYHLLAEIKKYQQQNTSYHPLL